jgi:hypothetical protein
MTSAQTGAGTESGSPEGRPQPCADCDPELLDNLKCKAVGIQAQADYNKAHEDALTQARTQYDGARSAYTSARSAAKPDVDDLGKQISQVIDQLKCLVDDERKIRLLDDAFWRVERRLRDCNPKQGCTFYDDCDFDDMVRDCRPEDIASGIADIERRTAAAADAFTRLIAEPADLTKRVADLKAEVADIVSKMASDSRSVDFKMLYAAALVARYHEQTIWHGFEDVNAYVDCLCRTLTCQIKGYEAVSELVRIQAVHQCHDEQKKTRCKNLEDHTADEVYAEYLRLKHEQRRDHDRDRDRDYDRDRDRDDDRDRDRDYDRDRDRDDDRDRDRDDDRDRDRDDDRDRERDDDRDRERESGGRYGHEERGRS